MRKISMCLAVVCCVVFLGGIAVAQQKVRVEKVLDGCSKEVETYCKDVTPGKGRILSCLYSYEDKISNQCQMAICEATPSLEMALSTLHYLAGECREDIQKYCSDVKPGQSRVINCLNKKKDVLTEGCKTAFNETVVY